MLPDVPGFVPRDTEFVLTGETTVRGKTPGKQGPLRIALAPPGRPQKKNIYTIWVTVPAARQAPRGKQTNRRGNRNGNGNGNDNGKATPLWVDSHYLGRFPDPARSTSKRVKAHARRYRPPLHFLKITAANEHQRLTPHFTLGMGVGPLNHREVQGAGPMRMRRHFAYFPPNRALLIKVEALARRLKAQGVRFTAFRINSAFRTPTFNRRVRGSAYSRHIYGDALDIMIDEAPRDARMDDINGDGRIDRHDGLVIAQALRELEAEGAVVPGGIGVYEYNDKRSVGCHVHIDTRGFPTRWGVTYRSGRKRAFTWWPPEEFPDGDTNE